MKSSEIKTNCPVCNAQVSRQYLNGHISQMARYERRSNLQGHKPHKQYQDEKGTNRYRKQSSRA